METQRSWSDVYHLITHLLLLKMKFNIRHATANAMPTVARMEKMIVREGCTDTATSIGTPSYGTPSRKGMVRGKIWQYAYKHF